VNPGGPVFLRIVNHVVARPAEAGVVGEIVVCEFVTITSHPAAETGVSSAGCRLFVNNSSSIETA
jgi:hypothetical protein